MTYRVTNISIRWRINTRNTTYRQYHWNQNVQERNQADSAILATYRTATQWSPMESILCHIHLPSGHTIGVMAKHHSILTTYMAISTIPVWGAKIVWPIHTVTASITDTTFNQYEELQPNNNNQTFLWLQLDEGQGVASGVTCGKSHLKSEKLFLSFKNGVISECYIKSKIPGNCYQKLWKLSFQFHL